MANIPTDFSLWSTVDSSNQPDTSDPNTIPADMRAIQAAMRTIFPNVNAALTATHTQLNYVTGVTSAIQTQINAKANISGGTLTGLVNLATGADIASASTVDLTAATGNTVVISGTTTVTAFTMNAGQQMVLITNGALPLTYHATNMNINGGANYTCAAGDRLYVTKDLAGVVRVNVTKQNGSAVELTGNQTIAGVKTFTSMPVMPVQSMVRLNTANGYGSTNTKIRRFTNVVTNQGTDITYADSATLGASFTINVSGVYAIAYSDNLNAATSVGLSLNSSQLTTDIATITAADRIAYTTTATASYSQQCGVTMYLTATDVVRAHTSGAATGSNPVHFTITRVS